MSRCQQFLASMKLLEFAIMDAIKVGKLIKQREIWTRAWIERRQKLGASNTPAKELCEEDPKSYKNLPDID